MPYETRTRSQPSAGNEGAVAFRNNVPTSISSLSAPAGSQSTYSFRGNGNDDYEKLSGEEIRARFRNEYKNRFDKGHEFSTVRELIKVRNDYEFWCPQTGSTNPSFSYKGLAFPSRTTTTGSDYPTPVTFTDSQRAADGRKLIAMTTPTAPEVSLAQILGELKEKLPAIPTDGFRQNGLTRQEIGGEYLNVEFGWRPLISDVEKAARAVADAGAILRQYTRDDGKVIRRRAHLGEDKFTVESSGTRELRIPRLNATTVTTRFVTAGSSVYGVPIVDHTVTNTWFAGAYSYYLAGAEDFLGKIQLYEQKANRLLGTRITLDTLYELTPWSWLFDWFGDLGTFFQNLSNLQANSTVLRYGYVMHRTEQTRDVTMRLTPNPNTTFGVPSRCPAYVTMLGTRVRKQRMKATPYGFGVSLEALSPRQWAILGALGMTKGDRKLRQSG